ncbi:MAG: hypothetical protein HYX73_00750 [Acidobacteria bacterium]|nr:hypothetical protein [Acidobacteriota bacterium]
MFRSLMIALCLISFSSIAPAQETARPRALGYVYAAPGFAAGGGEVTRTLQFGGGGEARIYKGLGAGADVGYLFHPPSFKDGFGLFSANGSYHFETSGSQQKVVPFVTSGYSLAFRSGTANLYNFGGGIDYWFSERAGLRLEARDHVWPGNGDPTGHFVSFRIGLLAR